MQHIADLIEGRMLPSLRAGNARIVPSSQSVGANAEEFFELSMPYPRHHAFFEWMWLERGQANMQIGERVYRLECGDYCLLTPGVSHVDAYDRSTPAYRTVWFTYAAGNLHAAIFDYTPFGQWTVGSDSYFPSECDLGIPLETLRRETMHFREGSQDIVTGLMLQIMATVLRSLRTSIEKTSIAPNFGRISAMVIPYLLGHYAASISLGDVARAVRLSPRHVATKFKQETGLTVFEKLAEIRMEQATRLLLERRLTLAEVAAEVGYQNVDGFSRTFHKVKGVPPSRYGIAPDVSPS